MGKPKIPLCVDLDGTLIPGDLLLESCIALLRQNPLYLLLIPCWLCRGKAYLKAQIARRAQLNHASLPFHRELVAWLREQKQRGRPLWLCTAANHRLAEAVANHLKLFDGVLASSDTHNLRGRQKAYSLAQKFGAKGFDYCGNDRVDLAVWSVSRGGVVVNASKGVEARARAVTDIYKTFAPDGHIVRAVAKTLRPHQWVKNLLLLVPLAAAHKLGEPGALGSALQAFVAFSLCASSVYVLNDMLDVESDRLHPSKSRRPFASGQLSLLAGFFLAPLLLAGAVAAAWTLPWEFKSVLCGYYALTLAYSTVLKRLVVADVVVLAALYTIRIVAGAMAVGVVLSFWLLMFSLALFFSLALVKRYAELKVMQREGRLESAGRGYRLEDLAIVENLGTAAGYLSVVVLALYINSPAVEMLYRRPQFIWGLCMLLLYWISRVWVLAHRGMMHDDPVVFALKDRASLAIVLCGAVTVYLAT
ncbi:hypothetical protein LMG31506_02202 [Cupriavidus yeoncheonensis]|uniref:UbiA family prenyltransferase n=1 Tax=Cupriavidus yeoncheonensis TaxID=1462994 RepID=A0A916IW04_9BURK|nr:UbiA family prenyltransferase [Cupriavidus yeoncheonensis]CAG2140162.1 hypothetical protein LMG31506_02202 [Cupriavidus yeoncheonensis]